MTLNGIIKLILLYFTVWLKITYIPVFYLFFSQSEAFNNLCASLWCVGELHLLRTGEGLRWYISMRLKNSVICADVSLRNYSLTHQWGWNMPPHSCRRIMLTVELHASSGIARKWPCKTCVKFFIYSEDHATMVCTSHSNRGSEAPHRDTVSDACEMPLPMEWYIGTPGHHLVGFSQFLVLVYYMSMISQLL